MRDSNDNRIPALLRFRGERPDAQAPVSYATRARYFAVILGLLYLYTDPKIVPLDVLMPAYAAIFWIIIPLRLKDAKVLGTKGAARFLSVVVWVILALAVTAATAVYFIWY